MVLLSGVVKTVKKICISITVPEKLEAEIKSPTTKGLKESIMAPPKKFESVPFMAKEKPAEIAVIMAIKMVISTPAMLRADMITEIFRTIPVKLLRKVLREAFMLFLSIR